MLETIGPLQALAAVFMIAAAVVGMLLLASLVVFLVGQIINHMPSEGDN